MSYTVSKLLKIAAAEIGYKEKETNSQLDNPSANAGDSNYTKYARDLRAAGYYQGSKQGFAWCDVFVDWCFLQLCGSKEKAEDMTCQTGLYGAGCEWSARYYKEQGRFFTSNPQPGDQIFFENYDHTGIVEKVNGITITTIEGNTGNQVARRTYPLSAKSIEGYGRPKYSVENSVEGVEKPETAADLEIGAVVNFTGSRHYYSANSGTGKKCVPGKAKITAKKYGSAHPYHLIKISGGGSTVYGWVNAEDIAELKQTEESFQLAIPVLRNGSKGATVKALQILLIGNGCSCGENGAGGEFGTATENAVMMYQDKTGLPVSGICDPATWKKLLGA
jgi:peptidoglycan hydrolase-like protein with peptidoglycan-binding domain